MNRALANNQDSERLQEQAGKTAPSRVEEGEPKLARTIGMVGAVCLVFWLITWVLNDYGRSATPRFNPWMVRLWGIAGLLGMLYQASRDRHPAIRKLYGLLGYALLLAGTTALTIKVVSGWVSVLAAGIVATVLGVLLIAASTGPFIRQALAEPEGAEDEEAPGVLGGIQQAVFAVAGFAPRWLKGMAAGARVQQVSILGVLLLAGFVLAGNSLITQSLVPYGLLALLLGLLFLVAYATNESDETWRRAGINLLGVVGLAAAVVGLGGIVTDWLGLEEIVLPYGTVFALLGLVFLFAFITLRGGDSDVGYHSAVIMGFAGLLVLVLALARGFITALEFPTPTLRIPAGFLYSALGGAYAAVGFGLSSDNKLVVMTRRELAAFFFSPVAYIVVAGMAVMAWGSFWWFLSQLVPSMPTQEGQPIPEPIIRYYFFAFFPVACLMFFLPAITMRLLSEEHRTGTIEVLLTAPVGEVSVVVSKFLAAWIFFMLTWGTWAIFPLAFRIMAREEFDYRPLMSFYLGMSCIAAGFVAMGLFFSSLTRNQIIAALLTFVGVVLLTLPAFFYWRSMDTGSSSQAARDILGYLSYLIHIDDVIQGKVVLRSLIFHITVAIFWLFLTVKVLEARKWR